MKKTLFDISLELNCLSSIACALSIPFGENCSTPNETIIGNAFTGFHLYLERLAEDLDAIDKEACAARRCKTKAE